VREAASAELSDEREQHERESRGKALVPPRTLHE
jgi:hypothetical protein